MDDAELIQFLRSLRERRYERGEHEGRSIDAVLDDWTDHLEQFAGQRWPVIRSGDRKPIAWALRLSVYLRDDQVCRSCQRWLGPDADRIVLDHMIPWSAGGPDDSDNLRTLCWACNERRSNYIDSAHLYALRPTSWWCVDCWLPEHPERPVWRTGEDLNQVRRIVVSEDPVEQVYCAHCRWYSFSPHYFVGASGRQLLEQVKS